MIRRLFVVAAAAGSLVVLTAGTASAHGIGGRADLPVPLPYFVVGAGAALVISFVALAALWPEPRLQEPLAGRTVGGRWLHSLRSALRWIGAAGLAIVVVAGFADGTGSTRNVGPVLVWVFFWLVVPFTVALVGNVWRWMSPWRTLASWMWSGREERPGIGERLGVWPAVAALLAFVWMELVAPDGGDPQFLAWAAVVYTAYLLVVTRWLGVETGLVAADAFETYNGLLGAISPISYRSAEWRVTVGSPVSAGSSPSAAHTGSARTVHVAESAVSTGWLRSLPQVPVRPGLAAFVVAMIGTVTFDGMSGTAWWRDLAGDAADGMLFQTAALLGTVVAVWLLYLGASWAAVRLSGSTGISAARVAADFAHTLVPIALAYAFAHYFTLVLYEGQTLLHAASDPFGLGWNLIGTADWKVSFFLSPTVVWYLQVGSIITGHIAGVVLAHDRALASFRGESAVRTQYAMLVLMIALTSLGLFVLAG